MFDDALAMAVGSAENFREGVRDAFGASMVANVLDPILHEIRSLRALSEELESEERRIDRVLEEARAISYQDCGATR